MSLIDDIKKHEGFSSVPYRCTADKLFAGNAAVLACGVRVISASGLTG